MKKEYIAERISKGEIDIENDGTLEQLKELLTLAFPKDHAKLSGSSNIYGRSHFCPDTWVPFKTKNRPIQSVKEVFEWKPERGEMVSVKLNYIDEWVPRIFLAEIIGAFRPFMAVRLGHEDEFNDGLGFDTINWTQMKKIEATEPKPEEIKHELIEVKVTLNGENINPMQFTHEQWNKIISNQ